MISPKEEAAVMSGSDSRHARSTGGDRLGGWISSGGWVGVKEEY